LVKRKNSVNSRSLVLGDAEPVVDAAEHHLVGDALDAAGERSAVPGPRVDQNVAPRVT